MLKTKQQKGRMDQLAEPRSSLVPMNNRIGQRTLTVGGVSLHGWSPGFPRLDSTASQHNNIISLFWSNPVLINRRSAAQ